MEEVRPHQFVPVLYLTQDRIDDDVLKIGEHWDKEMSEAVAEKFDLGQADAH